MKYGKIIEGNLIIKNDCKDDFSKVVEIKGYVDISEGATLQADNLSSVGGGVYISEGATLQADQLTSIGGYCAISEGATYKKNKNLKTNDKNCPAKNTRQLALRFNFECFLKAGFLFADGILAKIISHKKNVYKIQIVGQTQTSYCIQIDNGEDTLPTFSHGATIKEAKESLIYKISSRDTSAYKSLKLDDTVTFEEAVKMYRTITGACEFGTKNFVSTLAKKKKKYKISEIIEITKGQFGNDTFKEFFNA